MEAQVRFVVYGKAAMADEQTLQDVQDDDRLDQFGKAAVKVAASTVLATTLVSALNEPPRTDLMTLPDPVPIVYVLDDLEDDGIADEDEQDDEKQSRWIRLLKILKYLLVVLALAATLALAVLKGCVGLATVPLMPHEDEQQEQVTHQTQSQTEDERGVATAG